MGGNVVILFDTQSKLSTLYYKKKKSLLYFQNRFHNNYGCIIILDTLKMFYRLYNLMNSLFIITIIVHLDHFDQYVSNIYFTNISHQTAQYDFVYSLTRNETS